MKVAAVNMEGNGESAIWKAQGDQKRAAVQKMFGEIAPTYDLLNSLISFRLHHRWRAFAVRMMNLKAGDSALDVCCGTGDFLLPIKRAIGPGGKAIGVDFCAPMLDIAAKKLSDPKLALGDACRLPVADRSFDAVSVGWGIRNVPDVDAAHRELARVLKPGGRFVSLDMSRPKSRLIGGLSTWTFNTLVPKLGAIFGKREAYTYLPKSTQRFSTRDELKASMEKAGFVDVGYKDLLFGNVCLHWGTKR